jgi:hypothetical protein
MAVKREVWQIGNGSFFDTQEAAEAAEHEAEMERALIGEVSACFEGAPEGWSGFGMATVVGRALMQKFTIELKK